jgi:hypothetical protein
VRTALLASGKTFKTPQVLDLAPNPEHRNHPKIPNGVPTFLCKPEQQIAWVRQVIIDTLYISPRFTLTHVDIFNALVDLPAPSVVSRLTTLGSVQQCEHYSLTAQMLQCVTFFANYSFG